MDAMGEIHGRMCVDARAGASGSSDLLAGSGLRCVPERWVL